MRQLEVVEARKGELITPTGFSGYDWVMNPYVGCEFGCSYCYVRFFVKDKNNPWGEFVRLRRHIADKLPLEVSRIVGGRLVLGSMTDPYQPIERKERLTRTALKIIAEGNLRKVGIFTRSTIALDDIDLIEKLPGARIHITISPFSRKVQQMIEPIAVTFEARARMAKRFKNAGVQVWINASAGLPILSDMEIGRTAEMLAEIAPDGFYVDAMQPYTGSLEATLGSLKTLPEWERVREVLTNRREYRNWEDEYRNRWETEWSRVGGSALNTLPLWSHHGSKNRYDLRTGVAVPRSEE